MVNEARDRPGWVFHLHDATQGIRRALGPGLESRVFVGDQAMLSVVTIEAHSEGAIHSHPEEQWGVLLEGECTRIQGGDEVEMKPGDFWHTPGGVAHGIRTGGQRALVLDIFSPPRKEYLKVGSGFGLST